MLICGIIPQAGATIITAGTLTFDDSDGSGAVTDTATGRRYGLLHTSMFLSYVDFQTYVVDANAEGANIGIANRVVATDFIRAAVSTRFYQADFSADAELETYGMLEDDVFGPEFAFLYAPSVDSPWMGFGLMNDANTPFNTGGTLLASISSSLLTLDALHESVDEFNLFYLLYQDAANQIPTPSALSIFTLGLLGLSFGRFKKITTA